LEEDSLLCQSFAPTGQDDTDKVKLAWAYNMPAALSIYSDKTQLWDKCLRDVYKVLYKDLVLSIRSSLAASLHEIIGLVGSKFEENKTESEED
jgi:hypothetical protein